MISPTMITPAGSDQLAQLESIEKEGGDACILTCFLHFLATRPRLEPAGNMLKSMAPNWLAISSHASSPSPGEEDPALDAIQDGVALSGSHWCKSRVRGWLPSFLPHSCGVTRAMGQQDSRTATQIDIDLAIGLDDALQNRRFRRAADLCILSLKHTHTWGIHTRAEVIHVFELCC